MFSAFFLGSFVGFVTAIPVAGPVSALVFSHGLKGRYAQGRWIALGAALSEALYAFLAFFGFSRLLQQHPSWVTAAEALAAAILAALGVHFFRSKKMREPPPSLPDPLQKKAPARGKRSFLAGFSVSAFNPSLLATWTAVVSTLYSLGALRFSTLGSVLFSLGVAAGIFAWFSWMLRLMARHKHRLKPRALDLGLKSMGILLIAASAWIALKRFFA